MRTPRLALSLLCIVSSFMFSQAGGESVSVSGKLTRVMTIGAEGSGWMLQLDAPLTIEGEEVHAIEVTAPEGEKLDDLNEKQVTATGAVGHRTGVETGEKPMLALTEIHASAPKTSGGDLASSEWKLVELAGSKLPEDNRATLTFPSDGKVSGNGSCNRFSGTIVITGEHVKVGPLISTRMACPPPGMDTEKQYLDALEHADHYELKGTELAIYTVGSEQPMRFTRQTPSTTAH